MTEARTLNVRLPPDVVEKLGDLREFYRVDTDSQATRIIIREAWDRLQDAKQKLEREQSNA